MAKFLNLGFLVGDGLLELGESFPESFLGLRDLVSLGADAFVELVLQVDVPFEEGHAVDTSLGGEGDE